MSVELLCKLPRSTLIALTCAHVRLPSSARYLFTLDTRTECVENCPLNFMSPPPPSGHLKLSIYEESSALIVHSKLERESHIPPAMAI